MNVHLLAAMDWQLYGIAALYGCLSFVMYYLIRRFPLVCQLGWPLISVWGIIWVHIGMAIIYPETRPYFWKFATVFGAALPGMAMLYASQMIKLFHIFKTYQVSKRVGFYIYFREWVRDKVNEDVSQDTDFHNGYDCPDYYPSFDEVRRN